LLLALLLSLGSPLALAAQAAVPAAAAAASRAGRRPLLPRVEEIALARSAAPASVSASARVLVLTDSGYVTADSGSSGVTCLVDRSWPLSIEPHCYDAEGAATILPMQLRRTELYHRGTVAADVEREIAEGLASGRFRLPRRPALTFMMSAAQVLYDDAGRKVGAWRPHLMLYYPYLTSAELGLSATPDMRVGTVNEGGTPASNLMIIMPAFVPLAPAPAR
jgi:hypothetical protein